LKTLNNMAKALTQEERQGIEDKISSLSFPENFKEDKATYNLYVSNLREIYESEITGFNKDYAELLRNNNHRLIRPFIETKK